MGASLALAGVSACTRQPEERIVPYVRQPEEVVPGRPLFYATAMPLGGFGYPAPGRKPHGPADEARRQSRSPGQPWRDTSCSARRQCSRSLRPGSLAHDSEPRRSEDVERVPRGLQAIAVAQRGIRGRVAPDSDRADHVADARRADQDAARRICPRPAGISGIAVYGAYQDGAPAAHAIYKLDKADVVVSLDADFLGFGPGAVRYTKDFSSRRRMGTPQDALNRLYVVEPVPTVTGANADHRLALKSRDVHAFAAAVAAAVGATRRVSLRGRRALGRGAEVGRGDRRRISRRTRASRRSLPAIISPPSCTRSRARSTTRSATPTRRSPTRRRSSTSPADGSASLATLVDEMNAGKVDALFILGGNPVFTAPADLKFAEAMTKVANRIHLGLYHDETADHCHWHIPEAHYPRIVGRCARVRRHGLASCSRSIAPLYDGRTALEVMSALNGAPGRAADGRWSRSSGPAR